MRLALCVWIAFQITFWIIRFDCYYWMCCSPLKNTTHLDHHLLNLNQTASHSHHIPVLDLPIKAAVRLSNLRFHNPFIHLVHLVYPTIRSTLCHSFITQIRPNISKQLSKPSWLAIVILWVVGGNQCSRASVVPHDSARQSKRVIVVLAMPLSSPLALCKTVWTRSMADQAFAPARKWVNFRHRAYRPQVWWWYHGVILDGWARTGESYKSWYK